ncbi:MAG: DEAD/DEAH box helicase, partial [Lentisphaerae bacterium]|nr:DEAD/DEAH box helicase [Lentisphaerota bacterium]
MSETATFPIGSLVKARGREWVVVPSDDEEVLRVRPLGGVAEEECAIIPELETIAPARFELPDPDKAGDCRTSALLRNALRLNMRATTGPFRAFSRISVEPRPYQLVPLIMALRQETIRLLIADDVGVGKTVEALLIARELLDRGEIQRFCVLCPAHLCGQWVAELADKFQIEAQAVQPGTVARLERECGQGRSLFDVFPFTVVSIDYIKSDRRKFEFLRSCPELVIVDEAHVCSDSSRKAQQQRHRLLRDLSEDADRHMLLVSATPHSGIEEAFRSLLALVDPALDNLPEDLSGDHNRRHRELLAKHLVQRRRADITSYLGEDTPFPDREEREVSYKLGKDYRAFLEKVEQFVFDTLSDVHTPNSYKDKVRWWAALGLLRCVASSPAAAGMALKTKAVGLTSQDAKEVDALGRSLVMDGDPLSDEAEESDAIAGADFTEDDEPNAYLRKKLNALAKEAESLHGKAKDTKLKTAVDEISLLLNDGYSPIVYCRYIPTAEYVAEHLGKILKGVEVMAVTGRLHPTARNEAVEELGKHPKRVLVCTDCLSEGINLQEHFTAVFHYDLSWNPTRHEQRDGRVDRFGQGKQTVRSVCFYGVDTKIDGVVLDVLIRKHKTIKKSLGVSVPVPRDSNSVMDALLEAIFLRRDDDSQQLKFDSILQEAEQGFQTEWESSGDREKKSRTLFAQHAINTDEVALELAEAREAAGTPTDLREFMCDSMQLMGGVVAENRDSTFTFDVREIPMSAKQAIGVNKKFNGSFANPAPEHAPFLQRTHPIVAGLAGFVADRALSGHANSIAARCGVLR